MYKYFIANDLHGQGFSYSKYRFVVYSSVWIFILWNHAKKIYSEFLDYFIVDYKHTNFGIAHNCKVNIQQIFFSYEYTAERNWYANRRKKLIKSN